MCVSVCLSLCVCVCVLELSLVSVPLVVVPGDQVGDRLSTIDDIIDDTGRAGV